MPRSSRRGVSSTGQGRWGGRGRPTGVRLYSDDRVEGCRRVDLSRLQLLVRRRDGVLHLLWHVGAEGREELRVREVDDREDEVRGRLVNVPSTNDSIDLEDRRLERLQRAREDVIPGERLVGIDADRIDALLHGGVERAQAAEAGDLEHDVGALRDVVERDLLAQRLVDEVVRVVVQQRDVGLRVVWRPAGSRRSSCRPTGSGCPRPSRSSRSPSSSPRRSPRGSRPPRTGRSGRACSAARRSRSPRNRAGRRRTGRRRRTSPPVYSCAAVTVSAPSRKPTEMTRHAPSSAAADRFGR